MAAELSIFNTENVKMMQATKLEDGGIKSNRANLFSL